MPILYWDKEMKISKMGTGEMIMKMKKLMIAGMLALGACGMLAGCGGGDKAASSAAKAASGKPAKIVAGLDDTFAPMGFRDDNGKIVGFDIDMAEAVSKEIGVPIEFKPIDWASKETELNSGRIDCIWNGFTMTPERSKKISIQEASTAETALNRDENFKKSFSEIKAYPDLTACFMDLESGRCDAVLADSVLIEYYMTKKPGQFRELDGVVSKDTFSIGIKKDNQALVNLLNDGIAKVVASGEAKKISEKWFGKDVVLK